MGIVKKILKMEAKVFYRKFSLRELVILRLYGTKPFIKKRLAFKETIHASKETKSTKKHTLKFHIFRYALVDVEVTQSIRTLATLVTATCQRYIDPTSRSLPYSVTEILFLTKLLLNKSLFQKA
jgi:hypothetical protein